MRHACARRASSAAPVAAQPRLPGVCAVTARRPFVRCPWSIAAFGHGLPGMSDARRHGAVRPGRHELRPSRSTAAAVSGRVSSSIARRSTTLPTTRVPGVPSAAGCGAVPSSPSVPAQTRVRGETVAHTMAAGVSAGQPRSSRHDGHRGAAGQPHQHHDGQRAGGQRAEHRPEARLVVAGHHREARGRPAMGHGDAGERRGGDRGGQPRHHLEPDSRRPQGQGLLAAPPQHVGVAGLQPDHAAPPAGGADQEADDGLLAHRPAARPLADAEALRPAARAPRFRAPRARRRAPGRPSGAGPGPAPSTGPGLPGPPRRATRTPGSGRVRGQGCRRRSPVAGRGSPADAAPPVAAVEVSSSRLLGRPHLRSTSRQSPSSPVDVRSP